MSLLTTSAGLFLLAGLLGFYLLSFVLRKKETRKGIAFIHGPLAASGLVLLIIYAIQNRENRLVLPIVIFVVVAIGGLIMIAKDLKGKLPPRWLALIHGVAALVALSMVLVFIWRSQQ
jgi:hypothetical protein